MENILVNKEDIQIFLEEINSLPSFVHTDVKKSAILDLLALKIHSIVDSNNLIKRVLYLNEVCSSEILSWLNQDNFGFFMTFEDDKVILYTQKNLNILEDTSYTHLVYTPYMEITNYIINHYDEEYKPLSSLVMYAQSHNYFFKNTLVEELTAMTLSYIDNDLPDYLRYQLFIEKLLSKKEKPLSLENKQFLLKQFNGDGMNLNSYIIFLSKNYISKNIDFIVHSVLESNNQTNNLLFADKSKLLNVIKDTVNNDIFTYLRYPRRSNNLTILDLLKIENDFNIHSNIYKTIQRYEYSITKLIYTLQDKLNVKISFKHKIDDKTKLVNTTCSFIESFYSALLHGPIIDYDIRIPVILTHKGNQIFLNGFKDDIIMKTLNIGKQDSLIYSKCKENINDIINGINEIKNLGFEIIDYKHTFI